MAKQPSKSLTIFVHCMDGVGHLNSVIGLAQVLLNRGHRVIFYLNKAKEELLSYGFEFVELKEPVKGEDDERRRNMAQSGNILLSSASSLEKMKVMSSGAFTEQIAKRSLIFFEQLGTAIEKERPDLVLLDHVLIPPPVLKAKIPFVLVFSANPLLIYNSSKLPPPFSGYPTASDPVTWEEFRKYSSKFVQSTAACQAQVNAAMNYQPEKSYEIPYSPYLNIYGFPQEWDYRDIVPLPGNVISVDSFCRAEPEPFTLPEQFRNRAPGQKLLYLSLGSMASNDVAFMKRVTAILGRTAHLCIVSKGQRADEYELPSNCWGKGHLPQTSILPIVDLVITHGGNNTVTETFTFGKPMIVFPFFADHYCNAQRIDETGYGIRLDTHAFTDDQLLEAIEKLLNDSLLSEKLKAAQTRMAQSNSKEKACIQIEKLANL